MANCQMSRYLQIKTLLVLVGAEKRSWYKAECHRVEAEKIYAATMRLSAEQAATTTAAQKTINKATLDQLRNELDNILEYQANRAPSWVSLEGAEYPEREGSIKDFLAAHEMVVVFEEDEESEEEGEDDVETSDDKLVDMQTDLSSGMGDTSISPEGTTVAEKGSSEHGDEQAGHRREAAQSHFGSRDLGGFACVEGEVEDAVEVEGERGDVGEESGC